MIIKNQYHHHYESNYKGRDFIVGDLQGMFNPLKKSLFLLKFDYSKDRLFSVGDLIDRGPNSLECAELIYEDWFFPVQGNHELMMWQSLLNNHPSYIDCWINNGGLWFKHQDTTLLKDIATKFKQLPLIISVGDNKERFNIVHAEIILNSDDFSTLITNTDIDLWNFNEKDMNDMLWGRNIINSRTNQYDIIDTQYPLFQDTSLSLTYVGHSIVKHKPIQIQQQIYLDTGCVNGSLPKNIKNQYFYPLTIACPQEQTFYQYVPGSLALNKFPYHNMKQYK